jgi:exosortase
MPVALITARQPDRLSTSPGVTAPFFALITTALVWGEMILKLRLDWSTNAQYEFGPFVPLLICVVAYQRWCEGGESSPIRKPCLVWVPFSLLLFCLLPLRIIQEANPEWRPLNWVHASIVVTITFLAFALQVGWAQARRLVPPMLLIFLALPWTLAIEQTVIQSMARAVTSVTAELLNETGIPALPSGNVIYVPGATVGIADACSGVRSLAGTLMAAVFFGEFYRLRLLPRQGLVGIGIVAAFLFNLLRTYVLGWIAARRGSGVMEQWHDHTGLMIFCASFAVLWLLGQAFERFASPELPPASRAPRVLRVRTVGISSILALVGWFFATEFATEAWYRAKESHLPHLATWSPAWPLADRDFKFVPVNDEARAILRYSDGQSALWEQPGAYRWRIFFFRWAPGRSSAQLAVLHRPDICLPAAGLKSVGRSPQRSLRLAGIDIPFECYIFSRNEEPLFVFRALSEDRREPGVISSFDQSLQGRLGTALHGYRNLGQRLLQVSVEGASNEAAAYSDLASRLPGFIIRTE